MSSIRKTLRRIPSWIAVLLYMGLSVGGVYATLFWVPPEWRWYNHGRSVSSSPYLVNFRSTVSLVVGLISGVFFFADIHGPLRQPIGVPWFRLGLWGTAMSCWLIVPLFEKATGWSATWSPMAFLIWLSMAASWTVFYSWWSGASRIR